ncbi:MAG: YitT family protein, partial [Clostridia bacterium]
MNKTIFYEKIRKPLMIFLAALSTAVAVELLLRPTHIVLGGIIGIAEMIDILFSGERNYWFLTSIWLIVINIPIMILAFVKQGKKFATRTLIYIVLVSLFMLVFRLTNLASVLGLTNPDNKVLYAVVGGGVSGIALPLMLTVSASTGGTDIIGLLIQRKENKPSSQGMRYMLLLNLLIIVVSAIILKDMEVLLYSISATFVGEIVQESVFKGYSAAMVLEITTEKPVEISDKLYEELHHGATAIKIVGMYSKAEKTMILCVINKSQIVKARKIVKEIDPSAFAYVENVREVIGKGFTNKEEELASQ